MALLTMPVPGADFNDQSTLPNMIYQFEVKVGLSPDWLTDN